MEDCRHKRQVSLLRQSVEPELTFVNKAGWLYKRGKLKKNWLRRWYSVNSSKATFRYCSRPGPVLDQGQLVLSGRIVGAAAIDEPCQQGSGVVYGFTVVDSTGKSRIFYCSTEAQRNSWVWYLSRIAHLQVHVKDRYKVGWHQIIGSGAYADVVRGWDIKSGEAVAIKVCSRFACQRYSDMMNKEVAVMHMVGDHPHLLALREVFHSKHRIYIVTDYMAGGDLHDFVVSQEDKRRSPFNEREASSVVRQLLSALAHLHRNRIAHCDVKPENILLNTRERNASVKLIDYNSAVFFNEPTEPGGTPEYMAPELVTCHEDLSQTGWGPEPDMWAVGIVIYWLLCGYTPFTAGNVPMVLLNIEKGCFRWPKGVELSKEVKTLIQSLLRRRPEERPSAKELLSCPWVRGECPSQTPPPGPPSTNSAEGASVQVSRASPTLQHLQVDARAPPKDRLWKSIDVVADRKTSCWAVPAPQILDAAVMALPRNLSVRVMSQGVSMSYGLAPSALADADCPTAAAAQLCAGGDGRQLLEEDLPSSLEDIVHLNEGCTRGSPLDSCMSFHEDHSFTTDLGAHNHPLAVGSQRHRLETPVLTLETVTSSDCVSSGTDDSDCPSDLHSHGSLDPLSTRRSSSNQGIGQERTLPCIPLIDRLPSPSQRLEFHDLHQVMVRHRALRALVKAQRENQLPTIVQTARKCLEKSKSA